MKPLIIPIFIPVFISVFILAVLIVQPPGFANSTDEMTVYTNAHCVECHEEMVADHGASIHRDLSCLECHPQAIEEDHEQVSQLDCRQCHGAHDEKLLHDAHSRVACNACHIKGGIPGIEPESDRIVFSGILRPGMALSPHQAIQSKINAHGQCWNCHFQGNTLGASSMILPAKSILCMPCHVATFSVGDKTTLVSLFVFLTGITGLVMVWFSGSSHRQMPKPAEMQKTGGKIKAEISFEPQGLFSGKFFYRFKTFFIVIVKTLFMEVILLQGFYRISPARWIIHALIFFPFLFRFLFGLTALLFSIFFQDCSLTAAMLDKNNALRALFFDISGLMILSGSAAAIIRRGKEQEKKIASLPEPGSGMPAMIGLIVLMGFILEGLRIAMTGWPAGAGWAFLGYGISLLLKGMTGLTDIYGYVWYAHGILTGIFMALIPFTRMFHIITAPIVVLINAWSHAEDSFQKQNQASF